MLEKNSPKPLYQQLKDILVDAIDSEKWKANEKIPSETELSSIYGLSRMTVRSVLTDLVKEGLLYRVQGKGTFVAEKIVTVSPSYIGIREQLEKMGYEVETRIHKKKVSETLESVVASNEEAELLAVEKGHPLLLLRDVLYDEISRPYEYTKVVFRGDRIKIRLQYEE